MFFRKPWSQSLASERRRFLVTGDTAGVSGKPTHQAKGVWRTPIESNKYTANRTIQMPITTKSFHIIR